MIEKFEDIAGWYLIANIKENIPYGEKKEIRKGTKHFAPNTKIYCSAPRWGDGYENIIVGGRHRGSSKLVCMVINWTKLTNWRAEYTYVPPLGGWEVDEWKSQDLVCIWVRHLRWRQELRDARRKGFETINPDDALIYALSDSNIDAAKKAIARGADVNYRLRYDRITPLTAALMSNRPYLRKELVQFILDAGANIETVSYELIDCVSRYSNDYSDHTIDVVERAINSLFPLQKLDDYSF